MYIPEPLEGKKDVLKGYFDLENPTQSQIARLDTLAVYELAERDGLTNNVLLYGGQAVMTYFPGNRDTVDIDVAINSGAARQIFKELGYKDAHTMNRELKKESYKKRVGNTEIDLDIFTPGKTVLCKETVDQKAFEKAVVLNHLGVKMNVCNPVDLVASKLGTGRKKDSLDIVRTVLGKYESMDAAYLGERLKPFKDELLGVPETVSDAISHSDAIKFKEVVTGLLA